MGAVDTVITLADKFHTQESSVPPCAASPTIRNNINDRGTSSSLPGTLSAALSEHRRLFGFKPSKVTSKRKGVGRKHPPTKHSRTNWRKECICLKLCEQSCAPHTEEKIELAKMGLGLKEVTFDGDGDAAHIHEAITTQFPVFGFCGGYSLLRLRANSRDLVETEGPDSGLTVAFLKDIVRQAKLYVRLLQCDITEDDIKPTIASLKV